MVRTERRFMRRSTVLPANLWPLCMFLIALLGIPLIILALSSFWRAEFFVIIREFSLVNYERLIDEPVFLSLVIRSLGIGLLVAAITVPVAFVVAYAMRFVYPDRASLLLMLVMVSLLSSYLVRIYAWKTILGVNGVVNQALLYLNVIDEPASFLLYGDFAVIVTLTHILIPFAILPVFAALQDLDGSLLEAARDLGSSPLRTVATVVLPIAGPGLFAAFLFSFILASADYVTPQLVGGSSGMMVGRAIADQFGMAGDPPFGAALSVVLIFGFLLTIAAVTIAVPMLRSLLRAATDKRNAAAPNSTTSRRGETVMQIFFKASTILVFVFLYFPLAIVVLFSFNAAPSGVFPIESFSLRWYAELIRSEAFLRAARSSAMVGLLAIAGTLALGVPAAFSLARSRFRLKPLVLAMIIGPIAAPGIVIGTAFLATLGLVGLHGGLFPTVLVHILFTLPFVVLVVRARLAAFDWELEEAARDLGSAPRAAFLKVTLPIVAPAMIGASILVAALSLDEFIITNFVIGANTTLPVYIWSQMRTGITPSVNAIASIILLASLLLLLLALWVMGIRSAVSGMAGRANR